MVGPQMDLLPPLAPDGGNASIGREGGWLAEDSGEQNGMERLSAFAVSALFLAWTSSCRTYLLLPTPLILWTNVLSHHGVQTAPHLRFLSLPSFHQSSSCSVPSQWY